MNDIEIKQKIQKIADEKYKGGYRHLRPKFLKKLVGEQGFKRIYEKISPDLHEPYSLATHCFMNDILEPPMCHCGNRTKFNTTTRQFMKYCSNDCKWKDNDSIQNIKRETCLQKYGSINVLSSEYGMGKARSTLIEKYGVDNYTKTVEYQKWAMGRLPSEETKAKQKLSINTKFYNSFPYRYKHCSPLFSLEEYEGVKGYKEYKWLCKTCKKEFLSSIDNGSSPICRHCKPIGTKHELLIRDYLTKLNVSHIPFYKLPSKKEIDIYIPSLNLGIEVCGLYWHSTAVESYNKKDHITKHNECIDNKIKLITIFDDEIYQKKHLVLNRIKNLTGQISKTIYARKCDIKEIDATTCEKFLEKYHIQGNVFSSYRYGLFYKGRLVSIMTFNSPRYATGRKYSENVFELVRFCSVSNFKIVGAAGKLFTHFLRTVNPNEVYSYSDNRWGDGKVYEKLGMKFIRNTEPNYSYTKYFKERYNRIQYQKAWLKGMKSYDDSLTEEEIMRKEKFFRIWDCGSKLFIWKKES